jgi:hypothetical protein
MINQKEKIKLVNANFPIVVLKSEISQNFNEIIGEIEKWAEILG